MNPYYTYNKYSNQNIFTLHELCNEIPNAWIYNYSVVVNLISTLRLIKNLDIAFTMCSHANPLVAAWP